MVGGLNLGGSLEVMHNAIDVVELAVEKGASLVLMPVTARKQLVDLRINVPPTPFEPQEPDTEGTSLESTTAAPSQAVAA